MDASDLRWLPNAITVTRLAAIPALAAVIRSSPGPTCPAGAWLFVAISATDFVDGRVARLLQAETALGRVLDPLADRLVVAVGLAGLISLRRLPWQWPALILARDAVSMGAFAWFARRGVLLRIDLAGKTSSALVMAATGLAMRSPARRWDALFGAAVAGSLATFANYAWRAFTSTDG
jgi:phosphatidylglycerophosphate synthase